MRTPLFVSLATGATLLVGGGVAVAMAGEPVTGSRAAIAQPSPTSESPSLDPSPEPSLTLSPTPSAQPPSAPSSRPEISREQAQNIALRLVGGGQIESTELEWEDGRLIWDVDVERPGVKWDVEIDSRTGEVVASKADRDDSGRDDGRDGHRDDDRSGPGDGDGDDHHGDDGGHGGGGHDDGGHDDGDNSGPGSGGDDGDDDNSGPGGD
jgi:hypothetical protein